MTVATVAVKRMHGVSLLRPSCSGNVRWLAASPCPAIAILLLPLTMLAMSWPATSTLAQQQDGVVPLPTGQWQDGGGGDLVRREHFEYHDEHAGGWGRRRGRLGNNPLEGILPGLGITFCSGWLLWWNEGRAVKDAAMLRDARKDLVALGRDGGPGEEEDAVNGSPSYANVETIVLDPANDGRLVHVSGFLETPLEGVGGGGLTDTTFGLHRPSALRLVRSAEAYQWMEETDTRRTRVSQRETRVETTYRYHRGWTDSAVESWRFERPDGHENPPAEEMRADPGEASWVARDAVLSNVVNDGDGGDKLSVPPELIYQLGNSGFRTVQLDDGAKSQLQMPSAGSAVVAGGDGGSLYLPLARGSHIAAAAASSTADGGASSRVSSASGDREIHAARTVQPPRVGDVRVRWRELPPPTNGVSILARQERGRLVPWTHPPTDRSVYVMVEGAASPASMVERLRESQVRLTRILRRVGWFGTFLGLQLFLSCLPAALAMVPLGIGRVLAPLAGAATTIAALGGSLGLAAGVGAVAWLRFRPLVAAGLASAAAAFFCGPVWYEHFREKRRGQRLLGKEEKGAA